MLEFSDTTELAAELSTIDGLPLAEARAVAQAHLGRIAPSRVNWSDRERCGYCTGPHATADCRLRRPVFVGSPQSCGNCAGNHSVQRCPELWQALRAPAPETGLALMVETLYLAQRELIRATLAERVEIDGVGIPF